MRNVSRNDIDAIAKEWLKQTAATYPLQTVEHLLRERDAFRNPVGHALRTQLPLITEELLGEMDQGRLSAALENIIRIRAVQNFSASQSIEFLFLLKLILRQGRKHLDEDQVALEERIDQAVLVAFDLYVKCREKIYALMADEARRRVAQVEKIYLAAESR